MQVEKSYTVMDEEKKEGLLQVLSDKYCRQILEATIPGPKSAIEISRDTRIPISTVYRRLQTLHDNKLLITSGIITDEGKKFFLYKSRISAIMTNYADGHVEVKIMPNL